MIVIFSSREAEKHITKKIYKMHICEHTLAHANM